MSSSIDLSRIGDRMLACITAQGVTNRERDVLALIAYCDGSGGAYPSRRQQARALGLSNPAFISQITSSLERKGLLSKKHEPGKRTTYEIRYENLNARPFIRTGKG